MVDPQAGIPAEGAGERPTSDPQAMSPSCQGSCIEVDAKGARRTTSTALLGTSAELLILHGGTTYRLMRTRFGKLILQK